MKKAFTILFVTSFLMATSSTLTAASNQPQSPTAQTRTSAPTVVASKSALSTQELAKYQLKSEQAGSVAQGKTAGAASDKTVWIVVGVVAAVVIVAVAAGGGGGGGGGY
jgi:hypothetical protein